MELLVRILYSRFYQIIYIWFVFINFIFFHWYKLFIFLFIYRYDYDFCFFINFYISISIIYNKIEFGFIIIFDIAGIIVIINILYLFFSSSKNNFDEIIMHYVFSRLFNFFYIMPITSMFISFIRLMISIWKEENEEKYNINYIYSKDIYLSYSIIAKSLNLIFYCIIFIFY